MRPHDLAIELLELADEDERAAQVLSADPGVAQSMIGFHYQQAAEKLLKALLAERGADIPKTHDLVRLMELVEDQGVQVPSELIDVERLTPFAVTLRYHRSHDKPVFLEEQVRSVVEHLRQWVKGQILPHEF